MGRRTAKCRGAMGDLSPQVQALFAICYPNIPRAWLNSSSNEICCAREDYLLPFLLPLHPHPRVPPNIYLLDQREARKKGHDFDSSPQSPNTNYRAWPPIPQTSLLRGEHRNPYSLLWSNAHLPRIRPPYPPGEPWTPFIEASQ